MKSFCNTVEATGAQLELFQARAVTQEAQILAFFARYGKDAFTPAEVYHALFYASNVPLTSVRRAITNLTKQGKLYKTTEQTAGRYGIKNHKWRLTPGA